jgi:hypothetical protein
VQGRAALGRQQGTRIRRVGVAPDEVTSRAVGRCHARSHRFDLHAGLVVPAGQPERLERVCRYPLRPPVARERLSVTSAGHVRLQLPQPWADGTTHLVFDPTSLGGDAELDAHTPAADRRRARGRLWADLMRRTFGFDVLACPRCGGRLRWIAVIDHTPVIEKILGHLGLPTDVPLPTPARAPPPEHADSAALDFGS